MEPVDWLRDDQLAIFLFHGVIERHRHPVRNYTRKHIDRARFTSILQSLTASGVALSLDEAIEISLSRKPFPARAFVVTFDDGFENNLTVAAPILDDFEVPATFYLTTSFVDENAMSWIDRIEYCFEAVSHLRLTLPWRGDVLEAGDTGSKIAALSEIRDRVKSDPRFDVDGIVASIFEQCGTAPVQASEDELDRKMTWAQVRELAAHHRFAAGGHSHTHAILSFLSPDDLAHELDHSLSLLATRAGIGARHYSYPEGLSHCYSPAVIDALRDRGVVCCPTAEAGMNPPASDLFHLKRIMVS